MQAPLEHEEGKSSDAETHHGGDNARAQQDALAECPALVPKIAAINPCEIAGRAAHAQQTTANFVVEPIQRQIGEGIAHKGAGGGEQMVSAHQRGDAHAEKDLQPEEGVTAAEHASGQPSSPLAWGAFLSPQPGDSPPDLKATVAQQPAHEARKSAGS